MKVVQCLAVAAAAALVTPPCWADIILLPTDMVRVAWNQPADRSTTGSTFWQGQDIEIRERATHTKTHLQGVTYLKFDLDDLTPGFVNLPNFYAAFIIDYTARLNTSNDWEAGMSRVAPGNTWADVAGQYPMATWVGPANLGGTLTPDYTLVDNVRTTAPPMHGITLDVTSDIRDWVAGGVPNNGYVAYGTSDEYQGARFANAKLIMAADPSHYAAAVMADAPLAYYRLNETAGTVAANRANPAGYGTYAGAPALDQPGPGPAGGFHGFGADNYAVGLDGVDDHVEIPALGVSGNSARTYEGWFNGTDAAQGFFSTAGESGIRTGITASPGEVSMAVGGHRFGVTFDAANYGSPQENRYTPAELGPGWHHFAITFPEGETTSDQWQFIVNGVDYTSLARTLAGSPQSVNTLDVPGRLGMTHQGNPIAGAIDEFAVYGRDLGRQGVADHFAAALGPGWSVAETTFEMSRFQSISLQPHNDWPDDATNTDRSDVLRVRERTTGDANQAVRTRAFLEFDLSSLEGREVLGAILTLNQHSRNPNTGYLQLARVTDGWTADTLAFDQEVDEVFRFGGTNTPAQGDGKASWIDVTDIVGAWVSGEAENHGFRLAFDERSFVIADFHAEGNFAPQLIVTTAVPEPGAWLLLLAAFGCALLLRRRRKE